VAIVGPNGVGKSTLLKTINQTVHPLKGNIQYGANVNIAYFDQEMALLSSNKTVIDEIWDENRMMLEKEVRTALGSFLFTKDDVFKVVSELSGGEKVRLALAKLLLKKANFLILDEVTNHLDINSREVLEEALIDFPGTIIFVSHDRFFINRVATKVIEMTQSNVYEYMGDYTYFKERKNLKELQEAPQISLHKPTNAWEEKEKQKELKKMKKQVDSLEEEMSNLEEQIQYLKNEQLKEEVYLDYELANQVQFQLMSIQIELEEKLAIWTHLVESME